MKSIKIAFPLDNLASDHQKKVAEGLRTIRGQQGKVYRTFVWDGDQCYALTTTSKDIHLGMGQFSSEAQRHLCLLLDEEFQHTRELMVMDDTDAKAILVTQSMSSRECIVYQLSPAH
jgi:hypothetical protein